MTTLAQRAFATLGRSYPSLRDESVVWQAGIAPCYCVVENHATLLREFATLQQTISLLRLRWMEPNSGIEPL